MYSLNGVKSNTKPRSIKSKETTGTKKSTKVVKSTRSKMPVITKIEQIFKQSTTGTVTLAHLVKYTHVRADLIERQVRRLKEERGMFIDRTRKGNSVIFKHVGQMNICK